MSGSNIEDNTIYGDAENAIFISSSTAINNVHYNEISGSFESGIYIGGSSDQKIQFNDISGSSKSGIFAQNSEGTSFNCNHLSSNEIGLNISTNSMDSEIKSNMFNGSNIDFLARSDFNLQEYECNTGWDYAESFVDPTFNRFKVSSSDPNDQLLPTSWFPDFLFEVDPNDTESCCLVSPGPRVYPPGSSICRYLSVLNGSKAENYNFYWLRTYHFLRRYLLNKPKSEWPNCLNTFWDTLQDCGLKQLILADVQLRQFMQRSNNEVRSLRESLPINSELNQHERTASTNKYFELINTLKGEFEILKNIQKTDFEQVECDQLIFSNYSSIYLLQLEMMSRELNYTEISELQNIANLCPSEYGDAVHWAAGMLSAYPSSEQISIVDCFLNDTRPRSQNSKIEIDISIYPNPTKDFLYIVANKECEISFQIYNSRGHLIQSDQIQSKEISINTANMADGLYFMKISIDKDTNLLEKFVVQKD